MAKKKHAMVTEAHMTDTWVPDAMVKQKKLLANIFGIPESDFAQFQLASSSLVQFELRIALYLIITTPNHPHPQRQFQQTCFLVILSR